MNIEQIYRKIAQEKGLSPKEVQREIQAAIDYACQNPLDDHVAVR